MPSTKPTAKDAVASKKEVSETPKKAPTKAPTKVAPKAAVKATSKPAAKPAPKPKTSSKAEAEVEVEAVDTTEKAVRTRRVVNRDTVIALLEDFQALVDKEVSVRGNTKFVRSVNKNVRVLKNTLSRVLKQKGKNPNANTNKNSGFLKPVAISSDMAKFTGWNPTDLVSRVDVTKFICNYIKEKDLQNPEDRRQIVPDPNLGKLLNYDSKTAKDPLTYFRMQSLMKDHFLRSEPVDTS